MATSGRATPGRRVEPDPTGGTRALVLCGGGITSLTYEIGALPALDDLHSRRNIERKLVQVPVDSYRTPSLLQRLMRQTVFARRPFVSLLDDEEEAAG